MDKKVSIIMSTYNDEDTVSKAIESILLQTYKNWEFIICDDGSTDNTYQIIKKYGSVNKKIKIIRNSVNKGGAYSKNKCIKYASGEYIAGQDADDYSSSNRIEELIKFLEKNKEYAMVFSRGYLFDEKGIWGERGLKNYSPNKYDLIKSNQFIHPTMMIRKQCLSKVGGYRYSSLTYRCEDYDLWFRFYAEDFKGYVLDKKLYYFKEDSESYKRKKFKYRIDEMRIRWNGYKAMDLEVWNYIYVLKPLFVGLLPKFFIMKYHRRKYMLNDKNK